LTTTTWCLWDVTNECSIGIWDDYKYADTFLAENIDYATDVWTVLPYSETLEYIVTN